MTHRFIHRPTFHEQLYKVDQEEAALMQAKGCRCCGGQLHQAHYPRIGFGLPARLASLYDKRLSFCCGSCRRRSTPPSVRFFGRRRYTSMVFVLLSALRSSPSEHRRDRLARCFGVHISLATWRRWLSWWRLGFPKTALWVTFKAHFTLSGSSHPFTLLRQLAATTLSQRLMQALVFLSPITIQAI